MKYISKSMYIKSLSKTNKISPSKHLFFQSSSGFCSFPLQWWTMFFHLHLHDSKVSFCGTGMPQKEWVMKMVVLILNFFPLMVYWDIGTKWWQLLVPGTVSPKSYQGFRFSLTATISSLLIVRKVIPYMDDLQYSLVARNVKIWLLTGLCKLAQSFLHLYCQFYRREISNGLLQQIPMLHQCQNLTCGGKGSERPYSSFNAQHSCQ